MRKIKKQKSFKSKDIKLITFGILTVLILLPLLLILFSFKSENRTTIKSHAYANSNSYYGINWSPIWYDSSWIATNLDEMKTIGVQSTRIDVRWNMIETQKGVYNQSYLANIDAAVNGSYQRGINALLIVNGSPSWANGGKSSINPPTNVQDYADFVGYLINRYSGKVQYYEIWNEPDGNWSWVNPDPVAYTNLLKAAYIKAKSIDTSVMILGGSISNTFADNQTYLNGMYAAGAKNYFDILAQHTYGDPPNHGDLNPEEIIDNVITNIVPIMTSNNDGNKKIWITEHGYTTSTTGVTEAMQADYLTRAYKRAATYPNIEALYYYAWVNSGPGTDITDPEQNYGLLKVDSSKKQAYYSYKALDKSFTVTPTSTTVPTNTPIPTITPTPTVVPLTNLIKNYSFENTGSNWLNPWTFNRYNSTYGSISQVSNTKTDGNYSAKVKISKASTQNVWYVQLFQAGIPVTSGRTYKLTFSAKASINRPITVVFQKGDSDYAVYFNQDVSITTAWKQYTVTFTSPVSYSNLMLAFNLANNKSDVWFDNVSLK